jgi:hypothetical protein
VTVPEGGVGEFDGIFSGHWLLLLLAVSGQLSAVSQKPSTVIGEPPLVFSLIATHRTDHLFLSLFLLAES